jgi:hypothetical protein
VTAVMVVSSHGCCIISTAAQEQFVLQRQMMLALFLFKQTESLHQRTIAIHSMFSQRQ